MRLALYTGILVTVAWVATPRAVPDTIVTENIVIEKKGIAAVDLSSTDDQGRRWSLRSNGFGRGRGRNPQPVVGPLTGGFQIFDSTANASRVFISRDGKVGIGTTSPRQTLEVNGPGDAQIALQPNDGSGHLWTLQSSNGANNGPLNGTFQIIDRSAQKPRLIIDDAGKVSVGVLAITGGADVAEPFEVTTRDIPKGAIVSIDPNNPGMLQMSRSAYDKKVAGVVSGANRLNTGVSLRAFGKSGPDVALSGRVYALADASEPIAPGDLLTTSDVPGHCMKASDHGRAPGSIIGKAMTRLTSGRGYVLVLVSLQ